MFFADRLCFISLHTNVYCVLPESNIFLPARYPLQSLRSHHPSFQFLRYLRPFLILASCYSSSYINVRFHRGLSMAFLARLFLFLSNPFSLYVDTIIWCLLSVCAFVVVIAFSCFLSYLPTASLFCGCPSLWMSIHASSLLRAYPSLACHTHLFNSYFVISWQVLCLWRIRLAFMHYFSLCRTYNAPLDVCGGLQISTMILINIY